MLSFCDIETDKMQAHRAALPPPEPRHSRLAGLLEAFIRHAGAIAVDHSHMLPLDKIPRHIDRVAPRACGCES